MNGWIKIHNKLLDWEWATCPETLALWIHLLLRANYEERKWQGITIPRGSLVTGRKELAKNTGLSEQQIRTSLNRLKSTNEITISSTNKYSVITISKYDDYQLGDGGINQEINQDSNQQATGNQPAINQQSTTPKEYKNIRLKEISTSVDTKKVDELKDEAGKVTCRKAAEKREYAERVHLTEKEFGTLVAKYGEEDTRWMIGKLSAYKISKNKSYTSDYGAINSWVVDRLQEYREKIKRNGNYSSKQDNGTGQENDGRGRVYESSIQV